MPLWLMSIATVRDRLVMFDAVIKKLFAVHQRVVGNCRATAIGDLF